MDRKHEQAPRTWSAELLEGMDGLQPRTPLTEAAIMAMSFDDREDSDFTRSLWLVFLRGRDGHQLQANTMSSSIGTTD
jgi:hypothetical protein